jgi:hypothetical protein
VVGPAPDDEKRGQAPSKRDSGAAENRGNPFASLRTRERGNSP